MMREHGVQNNCQLPEIPRAIPNIPWRPEYPASLKSPVSLLQLSAPVNYANFSVMGTSPLVMSFKNAASGL
jgi:hypothetical protein